MLYSHNEKTRSIYLHWPFCPYRCHFCPFVALASQDHFMDQYHDALMKEIEAFALTLDQKLTLDTIFIGGGTPSTYPDSLLLDMFAKLKEKFDMSENTEVTIEVNPGTVRKEQPALWRKLGINRVSIGVQSLNDRVLKKLNRLQSAQDVRTLLPQVGVVFKNISIDLILGLPGVTSEEWKELLKEVVTWPLQHLSIYFLMVHENTRLYFDLQMKKTSLPADDSIIDLYHWSVRFLKRHGFDQYETSNFSRPGYECRHNIGYWERKPYKGFGLGACSFDGKNRFENIKNLTDYLQQSGTNASAIVETLTKEQVYLEKVMLGLRRSQGVLVAELFDGLTKDQENRLIKNIQWLKEGNYLQEQSGRIFLTPVGLVVQNEVSVRLSI